MAQEVHTDITRLLEVLDATGNNYNTEKIRNAYEYATVLHEGQFRQSGEAYISHPIAVAEIAATLGLKREQFQMYQAMKSMPQKKN